MNEKNGKVIMMAGAREVKKPLSLLDYFDPKTNSMVFYIRPFTDQIVEELEMHMEMMNKTQKKGGVTITKENGVYKFVADFLVTPANFFEATMGGKYICNMWGMMFRRYSAAARDTQVEQMTQKRYYKAVISNEFIESSDRVYVA